MPSIFIQIPSYCDLELPKTIVSAISNATGKTSLSFGVSNVEREKNYTHIPKDFPSWVKFSYKTSIAPQNIGLQKSRKIANSFYNGEDYYLQIDSHMRFDKDWDIKLIALLNIYKEIGFLKPLLTTYPPGYYYADDLTERFGSLYNTNCISFLENPSKFEQTYVPSQLAVNTDYMCMYTASVSGGFIFTTGDFAEITPNEKIAFWGEEILIAARAYTHGFDLLLPNRSYVWHLYHNNSTAFQLNARRHIWSDFPEEWKILEEESKKELKRIFDNNIIGPEAMGKQRTLYQYGEFAGLDFTNKKVVQCKWG